MTISPSQLTTGPGLPGGLASNPFPGQNGNLSSNSGYVLSADSVPDWSNALQPTSLGPLNGMAINFPAIMFKEDQKNSIAIHMFPNLDSGIAENLGRDPAKFHIRAILTNNIYPQLYEKWVPGTLFPQVFNQLIALLETSADKTFGHPLYGKINVQVETWSYELNPKGPRDGAIIDMALVESIPQATINNLAVSSNGNSIAQAANVLDNALQSVPTPLNPPGLSLSQMFGSISNTIQSITSIPGNAVQALDNDIILPVINGISSISGAVLNTPANTYAVISAAIQATKLSVQNTPIQSALQNYKNTFGVTTSTAPQVSQSFFSLPNRFQSNYDASTLQAMQDIIALNNTVSQNAFQFIDKAMKAVVSLRQHYINQNDSQCTPVIEALQQFLLQLQQKQSSLSANSIAQNAQITTYVNPTDMSWFSLSRYLNNSIDDLMALNQGIIYDFWVPAFSNISYYQS